MAHWPVLLKLKTFSWSARWGMWSTYTLNKWKIKCISYGDLVFGEIWRSCHVLTEPPEGAWGQQTHRFTSLSVDYWIVPASVCFSALVSPCIALVAHSWELFVCQFCSVWFLIACLGFLRFSGMQFGFLKKNNVLGVTVTVNYLYRFNTKNDFCFWLWDAALFTANVFQGRAVSLLLNKLLHEKTHWTRKTTRDGSFFWICLTRSVRW